MKTERKLLDYIAPGTEFGTMGTLGVIMTSGGTTFDAGTLPEGEDLTDNDFFN